MIVLSHRGYWLDPRERNGLEAFRRSFDNGFGTETDIRDCLGKLVVSHDMPAGSEMMLEDLLKLLDDRDLPLALNIKSDGLAHEIKRILESADVPNWFVFDMSVPDMIQYLHAGAPVFTRLSEYEREPVCYEMIAGIWLDAFDNTWFDADLIGRLLDDGKQVCVVSSELHDRDPLEAWNILRAPNLMGRPGLMVCTDFPERARDFFGG